jgi:predicted nucleic acid-binding protein
MNPGVVVIDASALLEVLLAGPRSRAIKMVLRRDTVALAPDVVNAEVLSALQRFERRGILTASRASEAAADLRQAPVRRVMTRGLIDAAWAARHNLSAYDAMYVVLARAASCRLVTLDGRLARAPNLGVDVLVP